MGTGLVRDLDNFSAGVARVVLTPTDIEVSAGRGNRSYRMPFSSDNGKVILAKRYCRGIDFSSFNKVWPMEQGVSTSGINFDKTSIVKDGSLGTENPPSKQLGST